MTREEHIKRIHEFCLIWTSFNHPVFQSIEALKQPTSAGDIGFRVDTTQVGIYDVSGKLKYRRPWCHPDTREAFNTLGYSIGSPDTQSPNSQHIDCEQGSDSQPIDCEDKG